MRKIKNKIAVGFSILVLLGGMLAYSSANAGLDCSTLGKSSKSWCESGSGDCLCTVIIE